MDDHRSQSRRSLLLRAALLGGGALAASVVPSRQAAAQKVSKQAMKYQDKPNGDQQCSNCMQFVPPSSCKVVDGAISPNGYCIAWAKKA